MGAVCCSDKDGEVDANVAQAPRMDPGKEEAIESKVVQAPSIGEKAKDPAKATMAKDNKTESIDYGDGATYTGESVDGKREGFGTYKSLSETYVGQWKADKQHGSGKHSWSDGRSYEGQYASGRFSGVGKMIWTTDKGIMCYEGEYEDDVKHGKGKFTWPNGNVYDGGWLQGKRHGQASFLTSSGKQKFGLWKEDKFLQWESEEAKTDGA
eukprot:TRINITY_DN42846_c0_g1_i1.p1 TRINITY_DN42846_c0_g1~~TRINITY_DN42846_c0_g1_i1.p1  ORF type:complete len:235 (-),score=46.12 TRINITY_DN42846_c0_g1_i1:123-752(-)